MMSTAACTEQLHREKPFLAHLSLLGVGNRRGVDNIGVGVGRRASAVSLRNVPAYLSDAWFDEAARLVAGDADLQAAGPVEGVVLQQRVTPVDGGVAGMPVATVEWYVQAGAGSVRLERGHHPHPDVTFECDAVTALAVARGELSAQSAFMSGRLRLGGDAGALLANQPLLGALTDVLAPVRPTGP
jgi:predicted lipid carrier protein YhbT